MGGSRNLHGVCEGRSEEDNREGSASLDWGYERCRQVMLTKQFWLYVSNYCTISVFQHGSSVGIVLHHWRSLETASAPSTILSETASVVTTWITPSAIVFAWNPLGVASSRFKMNERDWVLKPYPITAIGRGGIKFWGRRPRNCWMTPDVAATSRRHSVLRPSPSLPRPTPTMRATAVRGRIIFSRSRLKCSRSRPTGDYSSTEIYDEMNNMIIWSPASTHSACIRYSSLTGFSSNLPTEFIADILWPCKSPSALLS